MRTLTTKQLNAKLEVKCLGGLVFVDDKDIQHKYANNTYGLYVEGYGWLTFNSNGNLPYTPMGGRHTLDAIRHTGFINYNNIRWVKPITKEEEL